MSNQSYDLLWWLGCLIVAVGMVYVSAQLAWKKRRRQRQQRRFERAARPTPGLPLERLGCLFGSQWETGVMSDRSLQTAARVALPLLRAEVRRLATDVAAYQAGDTDCQDCAERSEMLTEAVRNLEMLAVATDIILLMAPETGASNTVYSWREAAEKLDTEDE